MIAEIDGAGWKINPGIGEHGVFDAGVGKHDAVAHDGIDHFGSFLNRDVQPDE